MADPGFSPGGAPTPKSAIIFQFLAENCMKMKEFGPPGGARVPGAPPWIRQCLVSASRHQLTSDHGPACMCHCIFFGINPRVSKHHAFRLHRATETTLILPL